MYNDVMHGLRQCGCECAPAKLELVRLVFCVASCGAFFSNFFGVESPGIGKPGNLSAYFKGCAPHGVYRHCFGAARSMIRPREAKPEEGSGGDSLRFSGAQSICGGVLG